MLWESLKSARDLGRLHDVATILIRFGFGDLVRRMGMSHVLERAGRVLHWKDVEALATMEPPQRLCRVLDELGPCYIKLGQVLATRVDIFPPQWIGEFEKLQDQAPPVAFDALRLQLEEDLGAPVDEKFVDFQVKPLAAASIAQVHRARLEDGSQVILKVRRPGIKETIEADLRLLARLAEIAESRMEEARHYRLSEIIRQFTLSLRRELDLASEGRNAERIAASFADDRNVVIPKVYWEWTCERLNVQEYIAGVRGTNLRAIDESGLNRKALAARGADAVLKMILLDGFFHADPHLGNFFCLPGNVLALIDFGMVGRLSEPRRDQIVDLFYALVVKDASAVADVLLDWGADLPVDRDALIIEVDAFLDHYHGIPLKRIDFTGLMFDLIAMLRDHQLTLPPDLALLFKAFITLDGVGRRLNPDFDMVAAAEPFLKKVMAERYLPTTFANRGWRQARDVLSILSALPADLRRVLRAARRGALQINVDLTRLDHFGHQLDRAASRMTVGVITAAIIVGSSIVMTVETGSTIFGMPVVGFIGFLGACLGGIWVLFSIWRGGRD